MRGFTFGIVLAALAFTWIPAGTSRVSAQSDLYGVLSMTFYCPANPPEHIDTCENAPGLTVTVTDEDGILFGSCVTKISRVEGGVDRAICFVNVPLDTAVLISQDANSVPDGYKADISVIPGRTPVTFPDAPIEQMAEFYNVPADDPVTQLPNTGAGWAPAPPSAPVTLLLLIATLFTIGSLGMRKRNG